MLQYFTLPPGRICQNCSQSFTSAIFEWKFNGIRKSRSLSNAWNISPLLLLFPYIRCTPSIVKKDVCDCTCAWEGGEKGTGTELQARMAPNIKITLLFPLHLIFWTSNQPRRISISRGPGLRVSSETSLLATHQNTSWAFHRARSQDCRFRFMDVFCLWLVLLFLLLLEFF